MAPTSKANANAIFDLKSAALTVLALMLKTSDLAQLAQALEARFGAASGLFEHEPLCVDLSALRDDPHAIDFAALVALLRQYGFNPMAVRGGHALHMEAALAAGLAEAPAQAARGSASEPEPSAEPQFQDTEAPEPQGEVAAAEPAAAEAAAPASRTLIIDKPLRSGQQVYARGGDLIVMAVVSFGAEVIADGSIHVYAPLRGRAIAGAQGDASARVFSACMEPQLVSIGGVWRTFEQGLPPEVAGKPAQVRLDGEKLVFEPLKF